MPKQTHYIKLPMIWPGDGIRDYQRGVLPVIEILAPLSEVGSRWLEYAGELDVLERQNKTSALMNLRIYCAT